jgi:hypothetical protein
LRPFVREVNTTNNRHDLHPKKKRSSTTIVKMSPRRQNERSFHEIEMEEMRRKIQLLQETVKVQPYWKHTKEDLMMIMTPVVTLHHLEAVAQTDVNLE